MVVVFYIFIVTNNIRQHRWYESKLQMCLYNYGAKQTIRKEHSELSRQKTSKIILLDKMPVYKTKCLILWHTLGTSDRGCLFSGFPDY